MAQDSSVHLPDRRPPVGLRRRLVLVGALAAVIGTLHFADHVIRGRIVVDRHLNPAWDHSGWPFQSDVNPFTISMILVYTLLLGGIWLTVRGRARAGYWLVTAVVIGGVVVYVHFLAGADAETPRMILDTYDNPAAGIPALIVLFGVVGILVLMAVQAVWVRSVSGHW